MIHTHSYATLDIYRRVKALATEMGREVPKTNVSAGCYYIWSFDQEAGRLDFVFDPWVSRAWIWCELRTLDAGFTVFQATPSEVETDRTREMDLNWNRLWAKVRYQVKKRQMMDGDGDEYRLSPREEDALYAV